MNTSKTRITLTTLATYFLQTYAMAAPAATQPSASQGIMSMLPMLVVFGGIFYFMLIRPQNKRVREHQSLIDGLSKGDEVTTSGGLVGTIVKFKDNFLILNIADGTDIIVQRQNILGALPKGTIKSCSANSTSKKTTKTTKEEKPQTKAKTTEK